MSTTDEKIDAALEIEVVTREIEPGFREHAVTVSAFPEVKVIRADGDPWTVLINPGEVMDFAGLFDSPAAARNLAAALEQAARVAEQLQAAGR